MLLKYFYDKELAQASYMVGCAKTGEALVVDPARDIHPYLAAAEAEGLRITHITETHIHADFVSGSYELAANTGATMFLNDMGDENWKYAFAKEAGAVLLRDGDHWMVGNIRIDVLHTPGHTPEHISFLVTDTAGADKPMGIFTGDFIFAGDVGRPDLLEEAAGLIGTKEIGARQQFHSVQRIKEMPDYLQIWPGHGAGSACGKALGAIPSTTLGYEKLFSPAFQIDDEETFVTWLLEGQPEAPHYFARMKYVNKVGPELTKNLLEPEHLDRAALDAALENDALIIDTRVRDEYEHAHIPGTISIPTTSSSFSTYVGWFVDYEKPLYFIAPETEMKQILVSLRAIGIDRIPGYFTSDVVDQSAATLPVITSDELARKLPENGIMIVDVRGAGEYRAGHIAGAEHIPLGHIPRHLDRIPHDRMVVTHCATGYRSQVAASLLRRYGYDNVYSLNDDIKKWSAALATDQD